jgi:hypothetical protein
MDKLKLLVLVGYGAVGVALAGALVLFVMVAFFTEKGEVKADPVALGVPVTGNVEVDKKALDEAVTAKKNAQKAEIGAGLSDVVFAFFTAVLIVVGLAILRAKPIAGGLIAVIPGIATLIYYATGPGFAGFRLLFSATWVVAILAALVAFPAAKKAAINPWDEE